jgi:hypothetical protein
LINNRNKEKKKGKKDDKKKKDKKKKKKKKKKAKCKSSTRNGIKWIEDERNLDYVEFKKFNLYGKYMKKLTNKFNQEMAWSKNPSNLSLKVQNKQYGKLKQFLNNLLKLTKSLEIKSQERIIYTKTIYEKLQEIFHSLGKNEPYKLKYDTIKFYWKQYDSLKASSPAAKVIVL